MHHYFQRMKLAVKQIDGKMLFLMTMPYLVKMYDFFLQKVHTNKVNFSRSRNTCCRNFILPFQCQDFWMGYCMEIQSICSTFFQKRQRFNSKSGKKMNRVAFVTMTIVRGKVGNLYYHILLCKAYSLNALQLKMYVNVLWRLIRMLRQSTIECLK